MSIFNEKRLLQICVLICASVPVAAGLAGVVRGYDWLLDEQWRSIFPLFPGELAPGLDLDSHFRYMSGLLLAIGLGFWSYVPTIETKTARFKLLTMIVVMGGMARLIGLISIGVPRGGMLFGLFMELIITPLLYLWQRRISRLFKGNIALQ